MLFWINQTDTKPITGVKVPPGTPWWGSARKSFRLTLQQTAHRYLGKCNWPIFALIDRQLLADGSPFRIPLPSPSSIPILPRPRSISWPGLTAC
ncbi:hypothetical protein E8F20_08225 [Pseudomonas sp. BN415]|nr:hypothetical protein [Pseudomonas sp. BN415]